MKINKNYMWMSVKLVTCIFQFFSTFSVFSRIFREAGRSEFFVFINTFLSILLIDVLFIAVLSLLEEPTDNPVKKLPWSIVGFGLLAAVVWIGWKDEGVLSWSPRLGLIGLVLADQFNWFIELTEYRNDRTRLEQRERDKKVTKRAHIMRVEWEHALQEERPNIRKLMRYRLRNELGLNELLESKSTPNEKESLQRAEAILALPESTDSENIFQTEDGLLAWRCLTCGEVFDHTTTGKPYASTFGIERAMGRHRCKTPNNGHVEPEEAIIVKENGW